MLPKISIVVITYNHEKYIADCIQSFLSQSFSDFELIVVDDGSTDSTRSIVQNFQDSRVIYLYQENSGPSIATNSGIFHARSEYVSIISGDDKAYEDRLEKQYRYFEEHPETTILFGQCVFINDEGQLLEQENPLDSMFSEMIGVGRYALFHRLFFRGNCFCGTSFMMRRSAFLSKTNGYQAASIQLQDYAMWLTWLKFSSITVINEKFVYYRIRANEQNLSNAKNAKRTLFEAQAILEQVLEDIDVDFFKKVFEKELIQKEFETKEAFALEKCFIYLAHEIPEIRSIGLKKLFILLQDPVFRSTYLNTYHFSFKQYYALTLEAGQGEAPKQRNVLVRVCSRILRLTGLERFLRKAIA